MNYEVKDIKPQNVIFVQKRGPYLKSAGQAWEELMDEAKAIDEVLTGEPKMLGICHDCPEDTKSIDIRYSACIAVKNDFDGFGCGASAKLETKTITGGKYAVFLHKGPYNKLPYEQIRKQLTEDKLQIRQNADTFEVYLNCETTGTKPENLLTVIHIPIK